LQNEALDRKNKSTMKAKLLTDIYNKNKQNLDLLLGANNCGGATVGGDKVKPRQGISRRYNCFYDAQI
jgi:hypothetical protein